MMQRHGHGPTKSTGMDVMTMTIGRFIYGTMQVKAFMYPTFFFAMSNWQKIHASHLSSMWHNANPEISEALCRCVLMAQDERGTERHLFFIHDNELLGVNGDDLSARADDLITQQRGFWIAAPAVLTPELREQWKATFFDYQIIPYFPEQLDGIPED